jgi:hypothetical protein
MEMELSQYLAEPRIPRESDIFHWLGKAKIRFPSLAGLAQVYLSAPAGSVASERLFSVMGMILDPQRNKLDPIMLDQLAFMKSNLEFWNFDMD